MSMCSFAAVIQHFTPPTIGGNESHSYVIYLEISRIEMPGQLWVELYQTFSLQTSKTFENHLPLSISSPTIAAMAKRHGRVYRSRCDLFEGIGGLSQRRCVALLSLEHLRFYPMLVT